MPSRPDHPLPRRRRPIGALAVALGLLLSFPAALLAEARTEEVPTGAKLAAAVSERFERAPRLRSVGLRIGASGGTVTLSGRLRTLALYREAMRTAASVRGVLALDDRMIVHPVPSDRTIEVRLWRTLSPHADFSRLDIAVRGSVVSATGRVASPGRLALLRDLAEGIEGVRGVDLAALEVASFDRHEMSREDLREAVERLIRSSDLHPIPGDFEVLLTDEGIVLSGRVPRLINRMEAMTIASLAGPDVPVVDRLEVDPELGRVRFRSFDLSAPIPSAPRR
jgi:osmotically-inducible protein OsmY